MLRYFSLSISLAVSILMTPAVQAHPDAGQIVTDLKRDATSSACSRVKVVSSDARYFVLTAAPSPSANDPQLLAFASQAADRVFVDKDAELLVVFFEASGDDQNVRSVSLSRSRWESLKSNPAPSSALVLAPADEASGTIAPAAEQLDKERAQLAERIETLKQKGVGVEPYLKVLQDCDANVKPGAEQGAREKLKGLTASVESQEKLLASRGAVRLKSGISQSVSLLPAPTVWPTNEPQASTTTAQNKRSEKPTDAYTLMKSLTGLSSINDLGGTEDTAADKLYLMIAAKALGRDCPDTEGPFLWERMRIALRIQELEHQRVQSFSYRQYNQDKIEGLVRARNPRYMHQIAQNIQFLERLIGVKDQERIHSEEMRIR